MLCFPLTDAFTVSNLLKPLSWSSFSEITLFFITFILWEESSMHHDIRVVEGNLQKLVFPAAAFMVP